MFVRKRRNKSGTTSVVVVDKSSGRFKELTTIGVASTSEEIAELEVKAQHWIDHYADSKRSTLKSQRRLWRRYAEQYP